MMSTIVSAAEEMNPLRRTTMEDCHVISREGTWGCNDPQMSALAVFDGHGGREMVEFLEATFLLNVATELNHEDEKADMKTRLERAFLFTDIQSRMMGVQTSGATVALCLIQKTSDTTANLHVANVGDARVVLSHERRAIRLSHDHRTEDTAEVERINNSGGLVLKNRVVGILAVSRSLGDHGLKEFVVGTPHITTFSNARSGDFVILACDGLWDVMTDVEAVAFVHSVELKQRAAQLLIDEAIRRKSADNITVVVNWL